MNQIAETILHIVKQVDLINPVVTYAYNNMSAAHIKITQDSSHDNRGLGAQGKERPCIYLTNGTQPNLSAVGLTGQMTIPVDQLRGILGNVDCFHMIVSLIF